MFLSYRIVFTAYWYSSPGPRPYRICICSECIQEFT
jgi:hypothetical protein